MRVYPCHKSGSYLIDFSYLDGDGKRRRYRKTAGRGVNQKQANKMAVGYDDQRQELHKTDGAIGRRLTEIEVHQSQHLVLLGRYPTHADNGWSMAQTHENGKTRRLDTTAAADQ